MQCLINDIPKLADQLIEMRLTMQFAIPFLSGFMLQTLPFNGIFTEYFNGTCHATDLVATICAQNIEVGIIFRQVIHIIDKLHQRNRDRARNLVGQDNHKSEY